MTGTHTLLLPICKVPVERGSGSARFRAQLEQTAPGLQRPSLNGAFLLPFE